jgi:hypothetical protein
MNEDNPEVQRLADKLDTVCIALQRIVQWSEAYPYHVFPEPDWTKAAKLLEAGGITIDSISAHCMRHVAASMGALASKALEEVDDENSSAKT